MNGKMNEKALPQDNNKTKWTWSSIIKLLILTPLCLTVILMLFLILIAIFIIGLIPLSLALMFEGISAIFTLFMEFINKIIKELVKFIPIN